MTAFGVDEAGIATMLVAMIAAGVVGGFIAGLLGVGGGIVIVPVLHEILTFLSLDPEIRMHVAVGTSLATIVATSIRSMHAHYQRRSVDTALLRAWAIPICAGVIVAIFIAGFVDSSVLKLVFAAVAALVACYMAFAPAGLTLGRRLPGQPGHALIGAGIGGFSTLMGIGGGTLTVPVLTLYNVPIRLAVGTAAAIGLIIAVPGTVGFIINGWGHPSLPPGSLGYVNLFGFAAIIPATLLLAPVGAAVAHRVGGGVLRMAFAAFLFVTSVRLFTM